MRSAVHFYDSFAVNVLCRAVQVTGYAVQFRAGLTFATVKGGGHMVPQTHPQAALSLLQQWMQDEL